MILFFIAASLLVVVALVFIIPSALKQTNREELDQLETNISIAKTRRAQLAESLAVGSIDQTTYDSEVQDLEYSLAGELSQAKEQSGTSRGGLGIAALIALFIPIGSGALYLQLGDPNAANTQSKNEQVIAAQTQNAQDAPPALEELLPNLEQKLAENPDDIDGWKLLGKSYLTMSDFPNAKRALTKAYELNENDPELLSQLAEVIAMERGGDLSGQPTEYLTRALDINPEHQQSLWLLAISKHQAGEYQEAIDRFKDLKLRNVNNPSAVASIDEMINLSQQEMSQGSAALESSPPTVQASQQPTEQASQQTNTQANADASNATKVTVTVSIANDVVDNVKPSDSVFIFARASSGPPMPLAVSRHVVSDLPVTVELDDTMAMIPNMTLSAFPSVTVAARVSPSGNAIAQPGDWFGEALNIEPARSPEISVEINTVTE